MTERIDALNDAMEALHDYVREQRNAGAVAHAGAVDALLREIDRAIEPLETLAEQTQGVAL